MGRPRRRPAVAVTDDPIFRDEWYTVGDIARLMGVSRMAVHLWRQKNAGPPWFTFVGGREKMGEQAHNATVYYKKTAVAKWVDSL